MRGVILDADSLGSEIDLTPITSLLDSWEVHPFTLPDERAGRVREATVVLSNKILMDDVAMQQATELRYISVMATGVNNIDFEAVSRRGIKVSNAVGYATPSVVQHVITLLLNLSTSMPQYLADVQRGAWEQSDVFCRLDHPIQEVAGKTLGIIGHGELGSNVARAAEGLGLKVLISDRPGEAPRPGRVAFEEVMGSADYISLHCPLTDDNRHMINSQTISLMKNNAFLINTARGGLVDSQALVDALESGRIAGAAIDVLDREPPAADEPLLKGISNLLVTPHNAWGAIESRTRLIEQMRENIEGFLAGKPPRLVT